MKTVVDRHTLPHLWANRAQPTARTASGNFSFQGETLYSYRTAIARHYPFGTVIAEHNYRATTNGHLRRAVQAVPNRAAVLYIDAIPAIGTAQELMALALSDAEAAHGRTAGKRPGFGPYLSAVAPRDRYLRTARAAAEFIAADRAATAAARAAARAVLRDTVDPNAWAAGIGRRRDRAALKRAIDAAVGHADVLPRELIDARHPDAEPYTVERAYRTATAYENARNDAIRTAKKLNARIPAALRAGLSDLVAEAAALMDAARDCQSWADYRDAMARAYAGRHAGETLASYGFWFTRAGQYRPECPTARGLAERYRRALAWQRADRLAESLPGRIADASRYSSPGDRARIADQVRADLDAFPERHPKRAELLAAIDALPVDAWRAEWADYRARLARSAAERAAGEVAAFREFGQIRPTLYAVPVMLRVSDDGKTVRTSHGATVSIASARFVWREVCTAGGSGREYPGDGVGIGDAFRLKRVRPDGSVIVGCHDIPADELAQCARALGLVVDAGVTE